MTDRLTVRRDVRSNGLLAALSVLVLLLLAGGGTPAGSGLILPADPAAQDGPERAYELYVAAESEDEVNRVRFGPEGAEVVSRVRVGRFPTEMDGPHGLWVESGGERWYLSLAHGIPYGRVVAYATGTDEKLGETEVGMFPASMQETAEGMLFVVNFDLHGEPDSSTVSVIDTETMEEVTRIPTCARPHGSRLGARETRHYSVCVADDRLVEIDTERLRVRRSLALPGRPERGTLDGAGARGEDADVSAEPRTRRCSPTWAQPAPDGEHVYVACNGSAEVLEIDLGSWTVERRFSTGMGPYNLDVTPDGRLLVVTYKGGDATGIWNLETGREQAEVPSTRRLPHGVAISPDSRYAFISVEGVGGEPGAVDVIDLRSFRRVGSADTGKQAGGIGFWRMDPPADRGVE